MAASSSDHIVVQFMKFQYSAMVIVMYSNMQWCNYSSLYGTTLQQKLEYVTQQDAVIVAQW